MKIKTVTWLTHVRRQEGQFKDVLGRLRDGKNTEEDWIYLNTNCAIENFFVEKWASFQSCDTIYLYETNKECDEKNCQQLVKLDKPICCIEAEHDKASSSSKSTEQCRRLPAKHYVAAGVKVMLLWNICTTKGLVKYILK